MKFTILALVVTASQSLFALPPDLQQRLENELGRDLSTEESQKLNSALETAQAGALVAPVNSKVERRAAKTYFCLDGTLGVAVVGGQAAKCVDLSTGDIYALSGTGGFIDPYGKSMGITAGASVGAHIIYETAESEQCFEQRQRAYYPDLYPTDRRFQLVRAAVSFLIGSSFAFAKGECTEMYMGGLVTILMADVGMKDIEFRKVSGR